MTAACDHLRYSVVTAATFFAGIERARREGGRVLSADYADGRRLQNSRVRSAHRKVADVLLIDAELHERNNAQAILGTSYFDGRIARVHSGMSFEQQHP